MPGLRDILEAATSEGMTISEVAARIEANVWLEDRAPELAALVLDMGEKLWQIQRWFDSNGHDSGEVAVLLARLDQLGKEQTDG